MQTERERILQGFEEMRGILDREEQKELQKLEEDEVNVLGDLTAAIDQVVQQKQYLSELVTELQRRMCESSVDMLQVRLGMRLPYMRFGGNTEIKFLSLLGPCTFFLIKRFQ